MANVDKGEFTRAANVMLALRNAIAEHSNKLYEAARAVREAVENDEAGEYDGDTDYYHTAEALGKVNLKFEITPELYQDLRNNIYNLVGMLDGIGKTNSVRFYEFQRPANTGMSVGFSEDMYKWLEPTE